MSRIFQLLQRHLQHVIGRNDDNAGEKLYVFSWEANFAEVVCTLSPKSHESKLEKKTMSAEHTTVFFFLARHPPYFFTLTTFFSQKCATKERKSRGIWIFFFPSIFLGKYGDAPILFLSDTKVPLSFQEAARRGETTPNFIILARLTRRNGKKKLMCPGDKKGKRSKDTLHNSEEGKRRKKTLQLLVRKKGGEGGFTFCRRLARERES